MNVRTVRSAGFPQERLSKCKPISIKKQPKEGEDRVARGEASLLVTGAYNTPSQQARLVHGIQWPKKMIHRSSAKVVLHQNSLDFEIKSEPGDLKFHKNHGPLLLQKGWQEVSTLFRAKYYETLA